MRVLFLPKWHETAPHWVKENTLYIGLKKIHCTLYSRKHTRVAVLIVLYWFLALNFRCPLLHEFLLWLEPKLCPRNFSPFYFNKGFFIVENKIIIWNEEKINIDWLLLKTLRLWMRKKINRNHASVILLFDKAIAIAQHRGSFW